MAYVAVDHFTCATRAAALTEIWTELAAAGWTVHDYLNKPDKSCPYTDVDTTAETITINSHGFVDGEHVLYWFSAGGTVIGGLTTLTQYFVVSAAANTFKLSLTQGGAAINLTSQGTGTHNFGEGYRVYSSNGEATDRIPEYIKVTWATANVINFQAYGWWNASTHAGTCKNSTTVSLTTSESGFYLWFYGNMNLVNITTKVSTTYYSVMFGHVKTRQHTVVTDLTGAATAGSAVSIAVTSTTGFEAGQSYQIFGDAGEGRDWITITSVTDATHMVITTLPRNYGTGAFIGVCPSTFGLFSGVNFYPTNGRTCAGTEDCSGYGVIATDVYPQAASDPDTRINKYLLSPLRISGSDVTTITTNAVGYHDEYLYFCPPTSMANEDTLGVTQLDTGTAESGGASTLTDTGKAWTINAHANKTVITTFGTGAGQIKKIASNTATELTTSVAWVTQPSSDTQYIICEEGYRYLLGTLMTLTLAMREGV
jgi:hypothetical protein